MSLPKEPRQKMINIMYLVLTALLALNVSAEILNAFKVVDNSLIASNDVLSISTGNIYENLDSMKNDPKTAAKAAIWQPRAAQVKAIADEAYDILKKYKQALKEESDLDPANGSFREDNIDASTRYFDTKGNGKPLYEALENFKKKLLAINDTMALEIGSKLPLSLEIPKSAAGNKSTGDKVKDWINNYFHMTPTIASLTILSKFQNDIKNSENLAATYCINQVGTVVVRLDKFEPLVGTSSTYLMPGEEMTVTAGLGAFNSKVMPVVSIDGASIQVNANGVAEKKFNVGGTGSRSLNVTVSFVDPNTGEKKTISKKIDYTVGAPSGISVSPDKMNVLYTGAVNPVTITAGAGSERVSAQFSGGSITKVGGSKYEVRPSPGKYGEQTITVLVDGKPAGRAVFRVMQLPDPVAYVGTLKPGSVPSANFKAMGGVIAKLENSVFDAPFEVVSYNIGSAGGGGDYNSEDNDGSRWTGNAAAFVSRLKPGSLVVITDIVVKDPSGKTRTLPSSISYILK